MMAVILVRSCRCLWCVDRFFCDWHCVDLVICDRDGRSNTKKVIQSEEVEVVGSVLSMFVVKINLLS